MVLSFLFTNGETLGGDYGKREKKIHKQSFPFVVMYNGKSLKSLGEAICQRSISNQECLRC